MKHTLYVLVVLLLLISSQAWAQNSESNELRQMRIRIHTLEQAVYRGDVSNIPTSTKEDNSAYESRLSSLEEDIKQLTAKVERLEYSLSSQNNGLSTPASQNLANPIVSSIPVENPEDLYKDALLKIREKDYLKAEDLFLRFVDHYPEHKLLDNVYYWLGESYYARREFEKASMTFLKGYEKFPQGNKSSDNLLKLAMSLREMGKDEEACITYNQLLSNDSSASLRILSRAREEIRKLKCS